MCMCSCKVFKVWKILNCECYRGLQTNVLFWLNFFIKMHQIQFRQDETVMFESLK